MQGGIGLVATIENLQARIPRVLAEKQERLQDAHETIEQADARIGTPFSHLDELREVREHAERIETELRDHSREQPAPDSSWQTIVGDIEQLRREIGTEQWWQQHPREIKRILQATRTAAESGSVEHRELFTMLAAEVQRRATPVPPDTATVSSSAPHRVGDAQGISTRASHNGPSR